MKLGVLGGTFDPVHAGHLYLGAYTREYLELDRVLFMVAKAPPHKQTKPVTDSYHRYAMTVLALQDSPAFFASRLELHREGPSYTIDTLNVLNSQFPDSQICFIAGSDSLKEVHLWKDCDKLFKRYSLVFVQRPGAKVNLDRLELASEIRQLLRTVPSREKQEIIPGESYLLDIEPPAISSTQLRDQIGSNKKISSDLISPAVHRYAEKYQIYGND